MHHHKDGMTRCGANMGFIALQVCFLRAPLTITMLADTIRSVFTEAPRRRDDRDGRVVP